MKNQITVDWEKTSINIKNRLSGVVRSKTFSEIFHLSEEAIYAKLRGNKLEIDELYVFATFLNCSIEDLIVFTDESFIEPFIQKVSTRENVEYSSAEEVSHTIDIFSDWFKQCDIRNLQEFFLYLPLMNTQALQDVTFRCFGNLTVKDRFYFLNKINYLYNSIDESPAKKYADQYRDEVLRVKGDGDIAFHPDELNEFHYYQSLLLYTSSISKEQFDKEILSFSEGK